MTAADDAFEQLMRLAGRSRPAFTTIEPGAPALPTRFAAEDAAAAALAAGGTVAADIWTLRGGAEQSVTVSTREAAAALCGYAYREFEDAASAPPPIRPVAGGGAIAGHLRTGDGRWIYLHPSFPDSARRMLEVLGDPRDLAAAQDAVLGWDGFALEDAIAAARACAAVVRTPREWDACEQGRVLAGLGVVEVIKLADAPAEPFPDGGDMPLSGVRVLDLTRVLAGPTCARTLAHYGADVLHVTSPSLPTIEPFLSDVNHGKLSASLDLDADADRARLTELAAGADVFAQGYRAGALERRGFGPAALHALRPGIVYTTITAYGHEGPWRSRAGWEQLAQSVTGLSATHGGADAPRLLPGAPTDYTTGFLAAFGTLLALYRRARYGGSYLVRASLAQTGTWIRDLGPRDAPAVALDRDQTRAWTIRSPRTDWGPMRHLRPPVGLSATPARWTRPAARLGAHDAAWPAA